jgi:hypothetical protein
MTVGASTGLLADRWVELVAGELIATTTSPEQGRSVL